MQKKYAFILKIVLLVIAGFLIYLMFIRKPDPSGKESQQNAKMEAGKGYENKKPSSNPSIKLTKSQIDSVVTLEKKGLITFVIDSNKVYIKPVFWVEMDNKLKEKMTVLFSDYCTMKSGAEVIHIEVYDKQSRKMIARYSQFWGYEVL